MGVTDIRFQDPLVRCCKYLVVFGCVALAALGLKCSGGAAQRAAVLGTVAAVAFAAADVLRPAVTIVQIAPACVAEEAFVPGWRRMSFL